MNVRTSTCRWCGKTYAIKDSTAVGSVDKRHYCSRECVVGWCAAFESSKMILKRLCKAWADYEMNYVPDDDEGNPVRTEGSIAYNSPKRELDDLWFENCTRSRYSYLLDRYTKWKQSHNWKKSFWRWDSLVESSWDPPVDAKVAIPSSSNGESHDDSEGGCGAVAVGLIVMGGAVWLIWKIIKTVWNWLF